MIQGGVALLVRRRQPLLSNRQHRQRSKTFWATLLRRKVPSPSRRPCRSSAQLHWRPGWWHPSDIRGESSVWHSSPPLQIGLLLLVSLVSVEVSTFNHVIQEAYSRSVVLEGEEYKQFMLLVNAVCLRCGCVCLCRVAPMGLSISWRGQPMVA